VYSFAHPIRCSQETLFEPKNLLLSNVSKKRSQRLQVKRCDGVPCDLSQVANGA